MAEDSQQRKDDLPPLPSESHQPGLKDVSGAHSQQSTPPQLSKETLYQQRQKCELRRLLKHTHPELKMLDDVVDEEFAEVLSSESVTAGETGYEGEVLSRRLIFENCGLSNKVPPFNPKIHLAKGAVERWDISKTSAVSETSRAEPHTEMDKGILEDNKGVDLRLDLNRECEDEMIRIDVQATRRIFENQSTPDQKKSGDETKAVKAEGKPCEVSYRENPSKRGCIELEKPPQMPCITAVGQSTKHDLAGREEASAHKILFEEESESFSDSEKHSDMIKTSAALFKNNPFISANMEKEHSRGCTSKTSSEVEDHLTANVKNRTHLFESMPFDKIRHQNKDDIETLVENIKETLNFLYCVNVIHSAGAIIEVNETMIAKRAKFVLSGSGPEIRFDEVAEGGAQNFILQLLPRSNLKPQITYLKEDSKESMEAMVVDVPVQQHHFNTNKDSEFKTANVAQLVEDILNQDNSLRKGVIIQEDSNNCADVIVYSLYKYFDKKDVKSYSPPQVVEYGQAESEDAGMRTKSNPDEASQDQTHLLVRPEMKGNVKLFKNCIEKGDLEYLKTLHAEPTVQTPELPQKQTEAECAHEQKGDPNGEVNTEWVPVDVKRLKNMFSGDKSHIQESCVHSAKIPHVSHRKGQPSTECNTDAFSPQQVKDSATECGGQAVGVCNFQHVEAEDKKLHQAELEEVVDKTNEISDVQTVIHNLQQTTMEAKSFCLSLQEKQKTLPQESSDKSIVSVKAGNVTHSRTKAVLPQEKLDQTAESSSELKWNKFSSASDVPLGQKCDHAEAHHKDSNSEKMQTADTCSKEGGDCTEFVQEQNIQTSSVSAHSSDVTPGQEEGEDVVLQGSVQAALKSLERSNINVTQGDFKAAMLYRNSNKSHRERSQNVDAICAQKPNTEESCQVAESESTQGSQRQEVTSENIGAISKKSKRQRGPKPAIPAKPKHLMVKQEDKESNQQAQRNPPHIRKNLNATQLKTTRTKETTQVPQSSPETSDSYIDEYRQHLPVHQQRNQPLDEEKQMLKEAEASLESCQKDRSTITGQQEISAAQEEKTPQNAQGRDNVGETDESPVDFHKACQKFGGKKATAKKMAPAKPKRVKLAQTSDINPLHLPEDNTRAVFAKVDPKSEQNIADASFNTCGITVDAKNETENIMKQESKVEMREKKVRTETEDERRQRLSVHMDEIMRGNITAAMEIFDNLRKQEQLQSILSRVEEIEQETSEVDVKSLRKVFEDVPDWVVIPEKKKPKKNRAKNKEKSKLLPRDRAENSPSMAHVYGDLERASEEIINLKEQTLARLMDIEEAIKKALYSVSTLKSDSDIAGLSCLFKESLGAVKGSSSNGNVNRISTKQTKQINTTAKAVQGAGIEVLHAKQQPSPPSSPAFISIQSAARKTDQTAALPTETSICPACQQSPKLEAKFRTTKTLTCNSPAQNRKTGSGRGRHKQTSKSPLNCNRELSVLEVQTDSEGNSIAETKTITENYERTDNFGNQFYSSKTSTHVDAQPETMTTASQAVFSPSTYQVTAYPGIQLPGGQMDTYHPK